MKQRTTDPPTSPEAKPTRLPTSGTNGKVADGRKRPACHCEARAGRWRAGNGQQATGRKLRLGVVGVGYAGELHAQKYASMKDVELVGVADINFERVKEMARRYNTKAYLSHAELLPFVDGVSLAVPTVSHFEIGYEILNHGIHLLVEKPIALKLRDADRLIECAKKNKTVLQIGHIERFNPAVIKMESLISKPIFIESHRLNFFTKRGTDVDVVLDLMIHDLDIILHIVNSEIREIDAVGMPVVSDKIDIANVRVSFTNGTMANVTASRVSNESIRMIRIFQPDNHISVDYAKRKISVTQLKGDKKNLTGLTPIVHREDEFPDSDPLADQIRSFVEAIKNGAKPMVSGVDGRKALAVSLSIINQIKRNRSNVSS